MGREIIAAAGGNAENPFSVLRVFGIAPSARIQGNSLMVWMAIFAPDRMRVGLGMMSMSI